MRAPSHRLRAQVVTSATVATVLTGSPASQDEATSSMSDVSTAAVSQSSVSPVSVPPPCAYEPYYRFCLALCERVKALRVRDKRSIFVAMRQEPEVHPGALLTHYGMDVSEFTSFQILTDTPRRPTGGAAAAAAATGDDDDVDAGAGKEDDDDDADGADSMDEDDDA